MVQILPEVPSFGKQFAQNLGAGFSRGLDFVGKMSLQKQKQAEQQSFLNQLFQGQQPNTGNQLAGKQEKFQLTPDQETMLALTDPTAFNAYKHLKEERGKEQETAQRQENLEQSLGEMTKTLLGGNLGYTPKRKITAQGRRDAQYFDSLGVQLESIGKEMVSKGVLSQARFAYLLSNLPSSNKTDASNAGALEAWYKELGMEPPEELQNLYKSKKTAENKKTESTESIEMFDKEGNAYDIPFEFQDQAIQQGLRFK